MSRDSSGAAPPSPSTLGSPEQTTSQTNPVKQPTTQSHQEPKGLPTSFGQKAGRFSLGVGLLGDSVNSSLTPGAKKEKSGQSKQKDLKVGDSSGRSIRITGKKKPSDGTSEAPSAATSSQSKATSTNTPSSLRQKWTSLLNIPDLLAGNAHGVQPWHARQAVTKLKSGPGIDAHDPDLILLSGHITLYKRCEDLLPGNIAKVPKNSRLSICKELEINSISIPSFTAVGMVGVACQETSDPSDKVRMLTPGEAETFSWEHPRLCDCGADDLEKGKLLQRCIMDSLLPQICKGEAGRKSVEGLCAAIVQQFTPLLGQQWSPMMKGALTEVTEIAIFLRTIMGTSYDSAATQLVVKVAESRRGTRMLAKQARP